MNHKIKKNMENNVELLSLKCASCGAGLEGFQNQTEVKCDFCGNNTMILRPIKVNSSNSKLDDSNLTKFNNLVSIMEKSMIAGNYKEAYEYCNKSLEVDPESAALWENKAICSFWLRSDKEIIESEAKEILTYLNAAKQSDPNSPTYETTSSSLASNLFIAVYYKYLQKTYDGSTDNKTYDTWTAKSTREFINYLNLMELSFNIFPSKLYLEIAINELTNLQKATWIEIDKKGNLSNCEFLKNLGFDAVKTREKYINKIKKVDPAYEAPEFPKKSGCFIATATMGNYNHPIVFDLRIFRDTWLLKRNWGIRFTKFYYQFGPYPANVISKSIILRKISYLFIVLPVYKLSKKLLKKR